MGKLGTKILKVGEKLLTTLFEKLCVSFSFKMVVLSLQQSFFIGFLPHLQAGPSVNMIDIEANLPPQ